MSERVKNFITLSRPWQDTRFMGEFGASACVLAEPNFQKIFIQGIVKNPGEIMGTNGNVLARLYSAPLSLWDQWTKRDTLFGDARLGNNGLVLVKNPESKPIKESGCGEMNAITFSAGHLFVAVHDNGGFKIWRPIRGRNIYGTNTAYQHDLTTGYTAFLKGLPNGYKVPIWQGK